MLKCTIYQLMNTVFCNRLKINGTILAHFLKKKCLFGLDASSTGNQTVLSVVTLLCETGLQWYFNTHSLKAELKTEKQVN